MDQNHSKKINLMGLSRKELEDFFVSIEEKPFRATQIIKWIHQRGVSDVSQMTDLSKALRQKLEETCEIKVPKGKHHYSIEIPDKHKAVLTRFILY